MLDQEIAPARSGEQRVHLGQRLRVDLRPLGVRLGLRAASPCTAGVAR